MARGAVNFAVDAASMAKFRREVKVLADRTGRDAGTVTRGVMQQVTVKVSGWTPPRQRPAGEKTIAGDLAKLATARAIAATRTKAEAIRLLVLLGLEQNSANIAAARRLTQRHGDAEAAFAAVTRDHAHQLPATHREHRDKRGRVPRGITFEVAFDGLRAKRLPVASEAFTRYLLVVYRRVGRLKAGWNRAAQVFRVRVPDWVWRHGVGEGDATDAIKPNGSGYLEIVNRVPYVGRQAGLVRRAMSSAIRLTAERLERALQRNAKAFGGAS